MIEIKRTNKSPPMKADTPCRVVRYGKRMEITVFANQPPEISAQRLNKDEYLCRNTGEIRQYNTFADKQPSSDSLKRTYKRLERTVVGNFTGGQNEIFLTLGYDGQKCTLEKLRYDWKLLLRKLRRKIPTLEYLFICEYSQKGLLHAHIFIERTDGKKLLIDRNWLIKSWGYQHVFIQRIQSEEDVLKLASYVNPFKNPRKMKTLAYFPQGFRHYRCSSGIERPATTKMTVGEAMGIVEVEGFKKMDDTCFLLLDDETGICVNRIIKKCYRKEEKNHGTK